MVTTGILNVKKKTFQRERALRYESVLPGTQVQIQNLFINNNWEIKFLVSTLRASRAGVFFFFFFYCTCVNFFFWTLNLCRILFLPICTSRIYSAYIFFLNHPTPHLTIPIPRLLRNGRRDKPWKHAYFFPRLIFLCHACCMFFA